MIGWHRGDKRPSIHCKFNDIAYGTLTCSWELVFYVMWFLYVWIFPTGTLSCEPGRHAGYVLHVQPTLSMWVYMLVLHSIVVPTPQIDVSTLANKSVLSACKLKIACSCIDESTKVIYMTISLRVLRPKLSVEQERSDTHRLQF